MVCFETWRITLPGSHRTSALHQTRIGCDEMPEMPEDTESEEYRQAVLKAGENWLRPEEIAAEAGLGQPQVNLDGFELADIVQYGIGDCYLMSALGAMAIREAKDKAAAKSRGEDLPLEQAVLSSMIHPQTFSECGAYVVRFFRDGKPFHVLIDDLLPCTANKQPALSHNAQLSEMWVALIEKAYAKFYTCYEAIEGGQTHQALIDMTNGAAQMVRFRNKDSLIISNDELWAKVTGTRARTPECAHAHAQLRTHLHAHR